MGRQLRISVGFVLLISAGCGRAGLNSPEPEPAVPEAPAPTAEAIAPEPVTFDPGIAANAPVVGVRVSRDPLSLGIGESVNLAELALTAIDAQGSVVDGAVFQTAIPRGNAASLSPDGTITALREGETELVLTVMAPGAGGLAEARVFPIDIVVRGAPVRSLQVATPPTAVYTGTAVPFGVDARTAGGDRRERVDVVWTTRNPEIISVSRDGLVRGLRAGSATLVASAEGVETAHVVQVLANPVRAIELTPDNASVRTGDVVRFVAVIRNARGTAVRDITLTYSVSVGAVAGGATPTDVGAAVFADGTFVAERPGSYRVVASAGGIAADAVVEVRERAVARRPMGVGALLNVGWGGELAVFRGQNGRDYAYVGAYIGTGAPHYLQVWDVTSPDAPLITDSVAFSGGALTDIEVNEGASVAVVAQGGDSGTGGLAVLNLADPAHPLISANYGDGFSGVRDASLSGNLVYAIHDGTSELIIFDLSSPAFPVEIGRWGIDRPGRTLEDVHVSEGIAYLAAGADGIWVLDVGDGRWGGSPGAPAVVSTLSHRDGQAQTAFPYRNADGHSYLFVGDEFVRVLSMEDPEHPKEVARYEVPEAGVQGLGIEDDRLHAAYAEAGLRIVDVSGELRGDLYRQAREIASFPTGHPAGSPPNTPMATEARSHGGAIFVSDLGSGLWVVRLGPPASASGGG